MLTNLRDAFSSQSRSPNIVPFDVLGMVVFCRIYVSKTHGKCGDLETWVTGH